MQPLHLALPSRGIQPVEAIQLARAAEAAGWSGVWLSEVLDIDVLSVAAAIASQTQRIEIGTAIVPISTRSAPTLAMSASTISRLAPGRFKLGLGVSTPALMDAVHDRAVRHPLATTEGVLDVLRRSLLGERVERDAEPAVSGFKLASPVPPTPLLLAALGERMTKLALAAADGLILNLLPVDAAAQRVHRARAEGREAYPVYLLVRAIVDATPAEEFRLRREIASYLRVPAYRSAVHDSGLSFTTPEGDLDAAAKELPDDVFAALTCVGDRTSCLDALTSMSKVGVTPLVVPAGGPTAMARTIAALDPHPPAAAGQRP